MLRTLSAIVTATAAGAAVLLTGGGPAAALDGAPQATPVPGTCSGVVRVGTLTFDPAQVARGGMSGATVKTTNCTGQSQAVTETWTGRFTSASGTGIPQGCPALDPLPRQVTLAPYAQISTTTSYLAFSGCTADRLTVTVRVTQGAVLIAQRSADLIIV